MVDGSISSPSAVVDPEPQTGRFWRWWSCFLAASRGTAGQQAIELLISNLSAAQRRQYQEGGCFDVIGGHTGARYRIRRGYQMNVEQLDAVGNRVCLLCFVPKGPLPIADIMLAQKLALELSEKEVLAIANTRLPSSFFDD
jgi:hypothetical protein